MTSHMEKSIQWGVKTVNEYRKEKGMPPIEGGDEAMMSCNVAPINSAKIRGEDTGNSENKLNNQTFQPKTCLYKQSLLFL